ncbi:hypothetical protein OAL27_01645 [Verrucomicrobiales bacterium]|nr:hypothetical protein [Verrucomicrobiales bacterium]
MTDRWKAGAGLTEIIVEGAEGTGGLNVPSFRDRADEFFGGDVNTSRIGVVRLV